MHVTINWNMGFQCKSTMVDFLNLSSASSREEHELRIAK